MYMNDGNKTKINLRNKSVFITGVAGFIGSNLAKRLLSTVEGVKVVGLDNMNHYYDVRLKEARLNELEQFDNFSFVKGNLADKAVIESIFEQYKPEIVVNLGAQAGVRYSITNPDAYVEANLIGFYNILEACRHSYDEGHTPVEHLVYASSSSVYGSNKKVPYSTDDKVDNPVSLYAATKKSNELMAHKLHHFHKNDCFRSCEGQHCMGADHWMQAVIELLHQHKCKSHAPPKRFYESQPPDSLVTTTQIAKEYGCGAKVFNRLLHLHGIQYRANNQWVLYAKHQDKGYTANLVFRLHRSDGSAVEKLHTAWTHKGRKFLYHELKRRGILPMAEQEG